MEHTDSSGHGSHGEHAAHGGPETRPTRERHAGHDTDVLWRQFWVTLILTVPVVLFSGGIQKLLGFSMPVFLGSDYVPFVFATMVFLYAGTFFLKGAVGEIRDRLPGMMTLISLAISVALAYSLAVTFGLRGEPLYWELSTLILIMLLARIIHHKLERDTLCF